MKQHRRAKHLNSDLRRRAEGVYRQSRGKLGRPPDADPGRLIEELRIHQIELELQNEELRQAQAALEVSRNKYFELFDLAPVGYFTVDQYGLILDGNLTAAGLWGVPRRSLSRRRFSAFLVEESQDEFYKTRKKALESHRKQRCEVTLTGRRGTRLHALLDISPLPPEDGDGARLSIAVTDITSRRRAEEALRKSEESLARVAEGLVLSREDERRRIAQELHDGLNQTLAATIIELETLTHRPHSSGEPVESRVQSIAERLAQVSDSVRDMAHELRPAILEHLGLKAALEAECAEFSRAKRIPVRFAARGTNLDGLSPTSAVVLYRVAQECLRNIARHSGAKRASVTLVGSKDGIRLSIRDDGVGFVLDRHKTPGIGILNMEEYMRLIGGSLTVGPRPRHGTLVKATAPPPLMKVNS